MIRHSLQELTVRFVQPLQSRLAYRVTTAVALPVVLFIVLGVIAASLVISRQISSGAMLNYRHDLVLRAERIGALLGNILEPMTTLARNTTISNGLIDSAGRETYLVPLLTGFNNVAGVHVTIKLLDFLGIDIASNGDVPELEMYRGWIRKAIDVGKSAAKVIKVSGADYILVVNVIVYSRTHSGEGALVFLFPLTGTDDLDTGSGHTYHITYQGSFNPFPAMGDVPGEQPDGFISTPIPVPPLLSSLKLAIGTVPDMSAVNRNRNDAIALLLLIGAGALFFVVILAFWIGQRLVKPLQELAQTASTIADNLWVDLPPAILRNDEVGALDKALRDMLGKLRDVYRTLEQRVNERTRELQEAMQDAEHASRAKSDFLSSMSHELRTPLNAILGFGQLLELDNTLNPDQQSSVQQILASGRHLLNLVTQLLDLTRIESGAMEITLEKVCVRDLLEECVIMMTPVAQHYKVALVNESKLHDNLYVTGDVTRLRQCVLNLVSNAIKYNVERGVVIVKHDQGHDDTVVISVQDTGIGIPADRHDNIFQSFSRLGQEKSAIEGTGIGLVLTQRILHLMDGSVTFISDSGKGSTFSISLPMAEPAETVSGERVPGLVRGARGARTSERKTVLYVEDNPANLLLVQKILETRPDIDLISAHNADLGIDIALSHQPDLILMDIHLPGKNGFAALAELRNQQETSAIPVIAVSAAAMPRDVKRALDAGFNDYLTKPLEIDKFLGILDRVFNSQNENLRAG